MSEGEECESLVIVLDGEEHAIPYEAGYTIIQAAWEAGVRPPISCLSGSCATCMAKVIEGKVEMRHNDVLSDAEIARGYVLTCQGYPASPRVKLVYED